MNKEKQLTAVEWLIDNLIPEPNWVQCKVIQQAKEMEKEHKYSIDFIVWYSGMDKEKIENAQKRWIKETFKSE